MVTLFTTFIIIVMKTCRLNVETKRDMAANIELAAASRLGELLVPNC